MYARIQELKALGYKKLRAARQLDIDTKTVRKYWDMTEAINRDFLLDSNTFQVVGENSFRNGG